MQHIVTAIAPSMKSTKGILFDIDGTLSDSFQLGFQSTQAILRRNGLNEITEEAYHAGTVLSTPRRLAWHVTSDPDNPAGIELGRQFDELYVGLVTRETTALYPGIKNTLELLHKRDVRMGVLSNACGAYVKATLKVNELDKIFPVAYGADEVPAAKPNPDGLLRICRELELDPKNCVYIGDSPSDGQAASRSEMKSIVVTWGSHPVENIRPHFNKLVYSVDQLREELLIFLNSE